jgi:multidrug transporter EmrE-like cation transporter
LIIKVRHVGYTFYIFQYVKITLICPHVILNDDMEKHKMIGWTFLAIAVTGSVIANLAFKRGMVEFAGAGGGLVALISQPWLWVGAVSAGVLLGAFLAALAHLPLSVVYTTITTLAMIGITVSAHLIYSEPLGLAKIAGVVCSVVGVALIASSASA